MTRKGGVMDWYEGWREADLPSWLATPRQDFDRLAAVLLPEAGNLLVTQGVFAPLGAVLDQRGGIERVDNPPDTADAEGQLAHVQGLLRDRVRAGPRRAAACVVNCTVILPGQNDPGTAAIVMCAHRDGTAAQIVFPYGFINGQVKFDAPLLEDGIQDIFPPIRLRPYVRSHPARAAGYTIGVFVVHGIDRAEVLRRFAMTDSGVAEDARPACRAVASLPGGWTALWCNSADDARAHLATLPERGAGATIVTSFIDEPAYRSAAACYRDGVEIWSVTHDGATGPHDLNVTGTPPAQLSDIIADMEKEEADCGYPPGAIDFWFDIPVALVQCVTGFSYCQIDENSPVFNKIVESSLPA